MPPEADRGISGVQGRLRNLGYDPGEVDGVLGERTRAAIRAFESHNSLPVTGDLSQALKNKLREQYGC
jgi:peptidoglycan hydrolase-like protein with peptidoglycan-binding domain